MSWDEKDWSYTWITGKLERFGLSKVWEKTSDREICHTIYLRSLDVPCLAYPNINKLDEIAKLFGVMIKYRFLGEKIYCYDYRFFEPILCREEMAQRDLVQEVYDIVSKDE